MTDPTERLAEALSAMHMNAANPQSMAAELTAQGFGHRDDILRAFADYAEKSRPGDRVVYIRSLTDSYLASFAAKEDTDG